MDNTAQIKFELAKEKFDSIFEPIYLHKAISSFDTHHNTIAAVSIVSVVFTLLLSYLLLESNINNFINIIISSLVLICSIFLLLQISFAKKNVVLSKKYGEEILLAMDEKNNSFQIIYFFESYLKTYTFTNKKTFLSHLKQFKNTFTNKDKKSERLFLFHLLCNDYFKVENIGIDNPTDITKEFNTNYNEYKRLAERQPDDIISTTKQQNKLMSKL